MTDARATGAGYDLRMTVDTEAFPRRLRTARKHRGWSMETLGREAGLSRQHVHELESGERPNMAARTVSALADALGTTVDWLLGHEGEDGRPSTRKRKR